jgi:hypothetical protein
MAGLLLYAYGFTARSIYGTKLDRERAEKADEQSRTRAAFAASSAAVATASSRVTAAPGDRKPAGLGEGGAGSTNAGSSENLLPKCPELTLGMKRSDIPAECFKPYSAGHVGAKQQQTRKQRETKSTRTEPAGKPPVDGEVRA